MRCRHHLLLLIDAKVALISSLQLVFPQYHHLLLLYNIVRSRARTGKSSDRRIRTDLTTGHIVLHQGLLLRGLEFLESRLLLGRSHVADVWFGHDVAGR